MHLFYHPRISVTDIRLEDEEFRHCVKVLRHSVDDVIHVTDGEGKLIEARITSIGKNYLDAVFVSDQSTPPPAYASHLYIAPTKQMERMEWMVEKCCEIGVASITFIQTKNAERPSIKTDRLLKKAISALKQSKSGWMTRIREMIPFEEALKQSASDLGMIAVVKAGLVPIRQMISGHAVVDIFIGPEGDFTPDEITLALSYGLKEVSLGTNVLRTETAGLFACTAVNLENC